MIQWDESKDNPVNIKIRKIWAAETFEECQTLCRELFELGHTDGQQYVWAVRAGDFTGHKITEHGKEMAKKLGQTEEEFLGIDTNKFEKVGDEWVLRKTPIKDETITVTNNSNIQQYVEFDNGKFRLKERPFDTDNNKTQ